MQYFTSGLLKSAYCSGLLLLGLGLSGCSTSEDTTDNVTNIPPVAVDDTARVDNGDKKTIDLAANDSDVDDGLDLTSIVIVTGPANGVLAVNADGTVDYTHDGSNTNADSFTYTIKDNSGHWKY